MIDVILDLIRQVIMARKHRAHRVYVVDDDAAVRKAIGLVLSQSGFETIGFSNGDSLLRTMRSEVLPHCILLDLQLLTMSGLEVLRLLRAENRSVPVLMISGQGSIAEAVAALKLGADDFIQKPFNGAELTGHVRACIANHAATAIAEIKVPCSEILTRRERQVMEHCVQGGTAKKIAFALGLSPRTVEDYRTNLMRKLGARSVPDLVRIVFGSTA